MTLTRELGAAFRLDAGEVLRSRWLVFSGAVYAVLVGIFLLVGVRESSVMGFTGMSRVLFSLCHALVLVLPLLALTATGQLVNRAREDGTLELLFSLPLRRGAWFAGVSLSRYAALLGPLVVLMIGVTIAARLFGGALLPWTFVLRTLTICASLLLAFGGLGLLISTAVRHQARAMLWVLLVWAAAVAFLDLGLVGLMLQWHLQPQAVLLLGALNPVQAARLALMAGAEPELTSLGPVGLYLSQHLGASALFALGTVWPALLGLGSWRLASRLFSRGDLV